MSPVTVSTSTGNPDILTVMHPDDHLDLDLDLRCRAKTSRGSECRNRPLPGLKRCGVHSMSAQARSSARLRVTASHRPDTITEERTCRMETLLKAGGFIQTSCELAGIPASVHDRWMQLGRAKDSPPEHAFYRVYAQRIDRAIAIGENNLVTAIAGAGDWRAAAWILERRHPERWGRRSVNPPPADTGRVDTPLTDLLREARGRPAGHG